MTRWSALGALALAGCANEYPNQQPAPEISPPCGAAVWPDPELAELVEQAAAPWRSATGCHVRTEEGDAQVVALDVVTLNDGRHPDGRTVHSERRIEIRRGSIAEGMALEILKHELGHLLGARDHVEDGAGIMSPNGGDGLIHADDLVHVCASLACNWFEPESEVSQ